MDCNLPGACVHEIFWARIVEWAAFPSQGNLPDPGIEPASLASPALTGGFFTTSATWETHCTLKTPKFVAPEFSLLYALFIYTTIT